MGGAGVGSGAANGVGVGVGALSDAEKSSTPDGNAALEVSAHDSLLVATLPRGDDAPRRSELDGAARALRKGTELSLLQPEVPFVNSLFV